MAREKDDLVEIRCVKCASVLATALPGSSAWCANCKRWTQDTSRKGK